MRFLTNQSLQKFKQVTGFDRAIAFTVLGRFWSAFVSLVTVLLIARFMTPRQQGYYYTFFSLVAIQIIFELGFSFVILQLAAHERTHLIIHPSGRIEGDTVAHSRLASILQKAVKWYSVAAVLMAIAIIPIGNWFFSTHRSAGDPIAWKFPWYLLVLCAAITFQIDPIFSFLEGCGFVAQVARLRLAQNMLGALLSWTAMLTHHGLFSPAMMILAQATAGITYLLTSHWRTLLTKLLTHPTRGNSVGWREEIWPFQWRIALSWLCGYFIFQIFTPVLFAFHGPVTAGQMGMSLTISSGIGSIAVAWMSTKAPVFGSLIARKEIEVLDRLFARTLKQSFILLAAGAATFFGALLYAQRAFPHLAARVLPPHAFALLLSTTVLNHIVFSEAIYLRAHKQEPFLIPTVIGSVLISTSTYVFGRFFGASAIALGYMLITLVYGVPFSTYVFLKKRREWHGVVIQHG